MTKKDRETLLQARCRELLTSKLLVIRAVQTMGGLSDSEVFKILSKIWRETEVKVLTCF